MHCLLGVDAGLHPRARGFQKNLSIACGSQQIHMQRVRVYVEADLAVFLEMAESLHTPSRMHMEKTHLVSERRREKFQIRAVRRRSAVHQFIGVLAGREQRRVIRAYKRRAFTKLKYPQNGQSSTETKEITRSRSLPMGLLSLIYTAQWR